MRPDRIIIGEVRSDEVLDMIQAMNTGHDGSMTTLHANSPLETLERLEVLALMGSLNISSEVARRQIISAIDLIVNTVRLPNGNRKIVQISEVLKGKGYVLEDIFVLDEESGVMRPTGKMPKFYSKLKQQANYIFREFSQEG
jgi:pilus assembly protein CpaF